jgi:predicted O-linked N-acetylglucosamine transferase (SPINDLY family)
VNLNAARAAISEQELDILVYGDIGMEAFTYYLAFSRLAPLQLVWPGHPLTPGIPNIDFFLSAKTAEPPDYKEHYNEEVVLFERVPVYEPPRGGSSPADMRNDFRLPKGPLYVCPMTLYKLHPDFDRYLADILARDANGVLVVVGSDDRWHQMVFNRMRTQIPDLPRRLVVLPWLSKPQFLGLLKTADAILDTIHFGGSGTTRDAFAIGAPVVTPEGQFLRGRLTAAYYREMGFAHLMTHSREAYVDLATRLANDKDYYKAVGREIGDAQASLFMDRRILREFEELSLHLLGRA